MTGWRLDPAGIIGVLNSVEAEREAFSVELGGTAEAPVNHFESIMAGLGSEAAVLAPVYCATGAALDEVGTSLQSVCQHISAGIVGVAYATETYQQGNEEMAAQCQSAAATAAQDGDFSFFVNS